MEYKFNGDLHLLLGRLDGKMDMLLSQQTAHAARMESMEGRVTTCDQRLTTLEADKANNKSNKSFLISIVSIFIAAAVALEKLVFK